MVSPLVACNSTIDFSVGDTSCGTGKACWVAGFGTHDVRRKGSNGSLRWNQMSEISFSNWDIL